MQKNIRHQEENGFTLIEVLIASAIFVILITTAVATFGFSSDLQLKTLAIREASQNARFIIEAIARDIRLADSFEISDDSKKIDISINNEQISYLFRDNDIIYNDGTNEQSLTNDQLQVITETSSFEGVDTAGNDLIQSYVKIKIVFTSNIGTSEEKNLEKFAETIETTVATRAYTKGYEGKVTSEEEQ